MKNFEYIAVSSDWSKQSWFIESTDEIEARAKLHKLWFSVLKIFPKKENASEHEKKWLDDVKTAFVWKDKKDKDSKIKKGSLLLYEFYWFDSDWNPTSWTIESKNDIYAYKRLRDEFRIDPEWIVLSTLSPAIKEVKKTNSVKEIIELAYDEWIEISTNKDVSVGEDDDSAPTEEQEQLKVEVTEFIPKIELLLDQYTSFLSSIKIIEIKRKCQSLEKIKRSNNVFFIQSELNEILNEVRDIFIPLEKSKIEKEDIDFLMEMNVYLWYENLWGLKEKIVPFLTGINFLKPILDKIKKKKDVIASSPEINQQKQKIKRYYTQLFHHLRFILTWNTSEKRKRFRALKKTTRLILQTYKTYNKLRRQVLLHNTKFRKKLIKWQRWFYVESRSFIWWFIWVYFLFILIVELSIKKWLFLPLWPSFSLLNSKWQITFLLFLILLNIILKLKIDYYLKVRIFNIISLIILAIILLLFYLNY